MRRRPMSEPTVVLVHGAGHTAEIWRATRDHLARPSCAVNLPGRAGKGGDLVSLNVASATRSVVEDIHTGTHDEEVVLVGHSVAGTLLPSVASQLEGRVRHLVFVAGVSAPEGQLPAEVFAPGQSELFARYLSKLRSRQAGLSFEELDQRAAHDLDSLSLSCEPMRWADVPGSLPRTFVRCLRDRIQSREVQSRLIDSCGAQSVIDIDTGHTPAVEAPEALARILSEIADSP
jgi:pimeloyl-ACP methyl ester carboxylesterase